MEGISGGFLSTFAAGLADAIAFTVVVAVAHGPKPTLFAVSRRCKRE